jgi:hypothetical protein
MMGASDTALATTWNQTSSDPSQELDLVAQGVAPSPTSNSSVSYLSTAIGDPDSGPSVTTMRDSVSNVEFTTDQDSLWLTFNLTVAGESTDSFHLFIDGRERSTFAPPADGTGTDGSFLILYDLESGTHTLSLVAEGETNGTYAAQGAAKLTNLRISSTTGIQRNLTPTQTKELIVWAVALVIFVFVILLALLLFLTIWTIKKVRRRSSSHE